MKITDIQCKVIRIIPKVKFKIAIADEGLNDVVILKIETDEGLTGYGEACPFLPVTGDFVADTVEFIEQMRPMLIGENPLAIAKIHRMMDRFAAYKSAGKAGIDMALYDLMGKKAGLPVYMLLGGNTNEVVSDMTVGIDTPENMAKLAKQYVDEGFKILKIKVGLNSQEDLEAVRLIREAVGGDISLRLDANQGWGRKEAINVMKKMEAYDVDEIEQPVPYWDFEGCRFIRERISQDLMMDESVKLPKDAIRAVKEECADIINIKLMKCGGLYRAMQINSISESANLPCMVGCMSETRLGIAAGAALVAAQGNILYADLDSYRMSHEIPEIKGGFEQEGGIIRLTDKPGLGVEVDF